MRKEVRIHGMLKTPLSADSSHARAGIPRSFARVTLVHHERTSGVSGVPVSYRENYAMSLNWSENKVDCKLLPFRSFIKWQQT